MGDLDLRDLFFDLYLIHDTSMKKPDLLMDNVFSNEETTYRIAKATFERGTVPGQQPLYGLKHDLDGEGFMSFEEFTRCREQTSKDLHLAYNSLTNVPVENEVTLTSSVASVIDWHESTGYSRGRGGRGCGGRGSGP